MTFTQTEMVSIVQNFTSRQIVGQPVPVSYGPNELAPYTQIPQGVEYNTDKVLFGTFEIIYIAPENFGINLTVRGQVVNDENVSVTADKTTLSINKEQNNIGFRSYQNVLFDKIIGSITEDTEIHFSGYLINLVDL